MVHETTTADGSPRSIVRFDGVEMSLYPRPIELRMPMDMEVFDALYHSFWRRDLWPGQAPEVATGWESPQRHYDVQLNLWKLFGEFRRVSAGEHCGRVAIVLDDRNAVEPDQYYFQSRPHECMIEGDYFQGVPRLIAEVLSPSTRALDRGQRMEVYRQAGVPHLWLLDPETETVEEYTLAGRAYSRTGRHGPGESFWPALFPEISVAVDSLFDTQEKRHGRRWSRQSPSPCPRGCCPRISAWGWGSCSSSGIPNGATRSGTTARHAFWRSVRPKKPRYVSGISSTTSADGNRHLCPSPARSSPASRSRRSAAFG